ncbi:MAG: hypothetical protein ACYTGP_01765 [Planctomycetota bacterium]
MSSPRTPEPRIEPRALRRRRIVFVVYALALTTATHWPRLELPPFSPVGDKTIHFLAFAVLAALLWRTRWIRHRFALTAIALAWAVLDELAQGLPGVNRYVTAPDLVSNALGVISAALWLWAWRPPRDARWFWGRALAVTAGAAAGVAIAIVVAALALERAAEAELPPGLAPRLELLAAYVNPGLWTTIAMTAASLLGALFVRTLRCR